MISSKQFSRIISIDNFNDINPLTENRIKFLQETIIEILEKLEEIDT